MLGIKRIVGDILPGTDAEQAENQSLGETVDQATNHAESNSSDSQTSAGKTTTITGGDKTESTDLTGEVVNETHHSHTTEEVEHQTEVERHQNVVNVVEQPLKEDVHKADFTENVQPTIEEEENRGSTEASKKQLDGIANQFEGNNKEDTTDKTVVDKGETVNETVHTHVQNVVVPVVDKDVHEHHLVKTVIPTHQVINEAPIVQKSDQTLEPMSRAEFEKNGGADPTVGNLSEAIAK